VNWLLVDHCDCWNWLRGWDGHLINYVNGSGAEESLLITRTVGVFGSKAVSGGVTVVVLRGTTITVT
jgi:hypothetical protein